MNSAVAQGEKNQDFEPMESNIEVYRSTTIKLLDSTFLNTFILSDFVELVIFYADQEKLTIEFHPSQIPILEKLLNNLRSVTEQQINQKIETLQWELEEMKSCDSQIKTPESLQNGNGIKQ
ncbi:hypothetical protein [Calothrix sp. CCY 0018]|uniref:hypothetical protein n=1 Tax=Calothrix sp. CCY 0018 TaxID=3103864 RepID=UPI0039C72321